MVDREEAFHVAVSPGESGEARIVVRGELDSMSGQQLALAYSEALKGGEPEPETGGQAARPFRISLDLGKVDFIDSGGLRALIGIQRDAERRGLELTVLEPPDSVTELLALSGLAQRVNLVRVDQSAETESDFLERVELEFEADDQEPSRARAAVRESLGSVLPHSALLNVVLMTSELVTNGVVHSAGGRSVGLRLTKFPDAVRVEVDDPGAGFDPSGPAVPDQLPGPEMGGRGLFVVDQCSSRWGIRRAETDRGRRFSVWFELETDAA